MHRQDCESTKIGMWEESLKTYVYIDPRQVGTLQKGLSTFDTPGENNCNCEYYRSELCLKLQNQIDEYCVVAPGFWTWPHSCGLFLEKVTLTEPLRPSRVVQ